VTSATSSLRRVGAFAAGRSRRAVNSALSAAEARRGDGSPTPLPSPPLLIVGAPRCGSTLLYQTMVSCFDVAYLSNLHCRAFGSPAVVERFLRGRRAPISYRSRHGSTSGLRAPAECGQFWYRFFPRAPQHVTRQAADPAAMRRLRASVRALQEAARRPVVFKNLICSLRVGPIADALPEAVFVVVRRDLLETAHSLLEARMRIHGRYDRWWSAEPAGFERMCRLPPEQQVIEQVLGVYAAIDAERELAGSARFVDVHYDELCERPAAVLDQISAHAESRGLRLRRRADPPARFARSRSIRIDPDLHARLVSEVGRRA
jgi:Sulfotransferase family